MEITSTKNPISLDPNLLKAGYNGIADSKVAADTKQAEAVPLLFGSNVLVSYGITDVEALVAQMKNENADSRMSMKLKTLSSIAQGLSSQQLAALEKSLALADSVKALERSVNDLNQAVVKSEAELAILGLQAESLQKQVENYRENQKEYNENIEKLQKEKADLADKLSKLEAEGKEEDAAAIAELKSEIAGLEKSINANIDGKNAVEKKIAELTATIDSANAKIKNLNETIESAKSDIATKKNEIASIDAEISVVLSSASIEKSTLKTIVEELAKITPDEKADSAHKADKKAEKAEATDIVRIIRDSMDAIATDILDEIAERREQMV